MENGNDSVCIIGLGYVGLTLGTVMADLGLRVYGVEKREEVVSLTCGGKPHFQEIGLGDTLQKVVSKGNLSAHSALPHDAICNVFIITVGTPLDANGQARLDMIQSASSEVAEKMTDDALVILRSTVKVGTARNVVKPILESSGKRFHIAMCPERTLEGNALKELRQLPQIVGADSAHTRELASRLFRRLTNSIVQVSTLETAEMIKLVDNTYRDVQFGFANEVARACDAFGINAFEVISSGKLGYTRTNVALPGLVGGPCLEKDPHILNQSTLQRGVSLGITSAARAVNENQPRETVSFITSELAHRNLGTNAKVALLGMAFKGVPATDDLRGSMSIKVLQEIKKQNPSVSIQLFDPVIRADVLAENFPDEQTADSLEECVTGATLVVIANNHPDLSASSLTFYKEHMQPNGFIFDYWSHFAALNKVETSGFYYSVGNTGTIDHE